MAPYEQESYLLGETEPSVWTGGSGGTFGAEKQFSFRCAAARRGFFFPRATCEGFSLCRYSAGSELSFPFGFPVGLPEKPSYRKTKKNLRFS